MEGVPKEVKGPLAVEGVPKEVKGPLAVEGVAKAERASNDPPPIICILLATAKAPDLHDF